ncbi:tetratricopeptide repeat protein [Desulfonema magnum]|uniref:Tetratricopeptide repeat-containing n=1 Tax=Desulfonema magnum TaxID=45655 RepID=A0A975GLX1_9BACT|nr:tetratricopeptide repeat protein [Desulfonema magnum]QTA86084.1 tetratricopeptide repeat-containing [Desulfonema magnum]
MRHQIIIKTNAHYQFGHDNIRAALYGRLTEEQKTDYHLKTATFLETKVGETHQELIPTIARHFVAAHDKNKAIEYSVQAAKAAEENKAEWEAFAHYRNAARFLEENSGTLTQGQDALLLEIYEKAAQFSSAAWIDAATCLRWLQKAIDFHTQNQDMEKVFSLSLSYIVTSSITGNYDAARCKIPEIIRTCEVQEGTIPWAILYGAGVCLVDWYQGYQNNCFDHAVKAISIFEKHSDTLPADVWPAYSWALFWRDKARAYLGRPVDMANVEKIRELMTQGKSDKTIYWHTLTAVTARAAFTGRWADLLTWTQLASQLSREMGKVFWFECWISHSYLYGALHYGEFSQLENHIEKVSASPDPYQVRLSYLFQGMLCLSRKNYEEAEQNLKAFLRREEETRDNSYLEGFIYLACTCLATGATDKAREYIEKGSQLAKKGLYENPLYQLQFLQLNAELAMRQGDYPLAETSLVQSLRLAEMLDNPLQKGFIQKLRGRLHLEQNNREEAEKRFILARDIFLSLNNKYQAARVMTMLEPLTRKKHDTGPRKNTDADTAALPQTVVEGDTATLTQTIAEEITGSLTRSEEEIISELEKQVKKTCPDTKNKVSDVGLEETEPEILKTED